MILLELQINVPRNTAFHSESLASVCSLDVEEYSEEQVRARGSAL